MILKYTQALHQAVYAKHFECVELLLSPPWFADRFAQNNKYVTPGQLAVSLAAAATINTVRAALPGGDPAAAEAERLSAQQYRRLASMCGISASAFKASLNGAEF